MKKIMTILAMAVVVAAPMTFVSCDDDNDWDYGYYENNFNLEGALNAYLNRYGEFGTDDDVTKAWFNQNYYSFGGYDSYYNQNYSDFIDYLNGYYAEGQRTMAGILASAAWSGPLTMYWNESGQKNYPNKVNYDVELDFDLDKADATFGRGLEKRFNASDGSGDTQATFNWQVDGFGNIIFDYDSEEGQGKGIEMVVYYADLEKLSNGDNGKGFAGTMHSNTEGLDEYDIFNLTTATYAKGVLGSRSASPSVSNKVYNGKISNRKVDIAKKIVSTLRARRR